MAYQKKFASISSLCLCDIVPVTLTTFVSVHGPMIHPITWQDLMNHFIYRISKATKATKDLELIQDYINYINKIQGIMNYYDNDVMIIPNNKTINAVIDPLCGIYECPVKKGHFTSRAKGIPLFIAFKAKGEIKTLYKVKDIVQLDIDNQIAIDALDAKIDNGVQRYPDFKKRIERYKDLVSYTTGQKWVFLLDQATSIDLYFPVLITSGAQGHEYRTLKEILNSPAKQDKGRIVLDLPPKNVGKSSKINSTANQII